MSFAICTVPAAPVRTEAAHRSEMCNQLLWGDAVEILEEKEDWIRVRTIDDQYEGWVTPHLITKAEETVARETVRYYTTALINTVSIQGRTMQLPFGAALRGWDPEKQTTWNDAVYTGAYRDASLPAEPAQWIEAARLWENAPYLWGGKTIFGVDCSGFVQTVLRGFGISLLRDAFQQAEQGQEVLSRKDARCGDLAFYQNEKGRVTHVALVIDVNTVIHAAGKVRIDKWDDEGIWNGEWKKYTHRNYSVRSYAS